MSLYDVTNFNYYYPEIQQTKGAPQNVSYSVPLNNNPDKRKNVMDTIKTSKRYIKPGAKKVGKEIINIVRRIIPLTVGMCIAMGIKSPSTHPSSTPSYNKHNAPTELYEMGKQHALDSIKIANLEKQVAELSQKTDSVKILEKASKIAKYAKK